MSVYHQVEGEGRDAARLRRGAQRQRAGGRESKGQEVRDALGAVRDPELNRAITDLGFVGGVRVDGGQVHVRVRLPTYSTPDSVWMVVADAKAAVTALSWVDSVEVCPADPLTPLETDTAVPPTPEPFNDLERGRRVCRRRAFCVRQHEILAELLDRGVGRAALCRMSVGDLTPSADTAVYLQRRSELGVSITDDAPLVVTEEGTAVTPREIGDYLLRLRSIAGGVIRCQDG
jgi:metal-sulfur cluster biosynthetic enzyme